MKKVGLEARNVNMADIIHNAHPQSTLYINGRLSNNQIYNFQKMKDLIKILLFMIETKEWKTNSKKTLFMKSIDLKL